MARLAWFALLVVPIASGISCVLFTDTDGFSDGGDPASNSADGGGAPDGASVVDGAAVLDSSSEGGPNRVILFSESFDEELSPAWHKTQGGGALFEISAERSKSAPQAGHTRQTGAGG